MRSPARRSGRCSIGHHSAQEDFALGTLMANRRRREVERLIGFFANTLALRTDLSGNPTFRELLRRERETALEAYSHQDLPFEKLVEELKPPRDLSRTPVFQVMLILQNAPVHERSLTGLSMVPVGVDSRTAKLDCMLYLTEEEGGVRGFLEYNTDLFDRATVARMLGHFLSLLEGVAANPELPLSDLPLLPADERRTLLVDWNATRAEYPEEATLHALIERQAGQAPGAVALQMEGETMSYGELDARANRLARHLRGLGVGPDVLVGLAVERSFDMLVGLLGILKAGGAYVPLDPEYPAERLAYMVASSGLPVLVTQERLVGTLTVPGSPVQVVALDRDAARIARHDDGPLPGGALPENLAYVIYTSGSTGQPKGVQIPHRAVVNFLSSMGRRPGLGAGDRLLAVTTLSFDIAGLELYLPLVHGARVVLVPREVAQAGEQLVERIAGSGATVMQATPATWRLLLDGGWTGRAGLKVLCGGEAVPRELAESLLAAVGEVWNVYGPTEATIWSTVHRLEQGGRISIGQPIDNTQVYLVSRHLEPVAVGVPGELMIGGAGLSRGYRGRPDLTAERFIPDPFSAGPGARLYRTGDLARWLPDGTLDFLGRIDHQVKVRGFRIELGEIEAALAQHPGIRQNVVIVREDTPGAKRLVAYLAAAEGEAPKAADLRAFLKEKLPEYMIPALFLPLEALPLTPNGKIDRRALPAPDKSVLASAREYVAPSTPEEETLAAIWAEVLGLDRIGAQDDFFEMGGDSLLVIKVVSKATKAGIGVTTKQLFQNRTIRELAAVAGTSQILAEQEPVVGPARPHARPGPLPRVRSPEPELAFPGQPPPAAGPPPRPRGDARRLDGGGQPPRQPAGAARASNRGGRENRWQLVCDPPIEGFPLPEVDLTGLAADRHPRAMTDAVTQLIRSFDMEGGRLFRGLVLDRGGEDRASVFLTGQFLAADIGSWTVLLDDLDTAYRQLVAGEPVKLQPKTTSARQWSQRLAERARDGMNAEERSYWLDRPAVQQDPLPLDLPGGTNFWDSVATVRFDLEAEESRLLLQEVPRAYGVQIDGILMTAILLAFERWIGARSLGFHLIGHGARLCTTTST
jgi:amino acid adenylation domain-containing protein